MPFAKCYYHIVWATKHRAAVIDPKLQVLIQGIIQHKSTELHSPLLAIYAMPDHVHVAVRVSTQIAVADWARRVKGISSHEVNGAFPDLETTLLLARNRPASSSTTSSNSASITRIIISMRCLKIRMMGDLVRRRINPSAR